MKRHIILILLFLAVFAVFTVSVSAQDIDVDSMSNEQLIVLLQSVLNKLQGDQADRSPAETAETEQAPVPVAETKPEETDEPEAFHVYENKKLKVEKLPDSMFVMPEKHGKDKKHDKSGGDKEDCDSKCMKYSDFYGKMMLDMGCYAKCVGDI